MSAPHRIVCFGSSRVEPSDLAWKLAHEVGATLARHGCSVLSGGYEGTMGAVTRGAAEAGGRTLGVITPIFPDREPNAHLDEVFVEPDYVSRMSFLLRGGDGYVALPGALGTLSEWLSAWCLASIDQLGGPLWVFEDPWRPVVEAVEKLPEMGGRLSHHVQWLETADDLDRALKSWRGSASS